MGIVFDHLYKLSKRKHIGIFINFFGYLYLSFWNHIFNKIPSYYIRYFICKYLYGLKIGRSNIHFNVKFFSPWNIEIGDNVNIQMNCLLDGRGGLIIGNNVDITIGVKIFTEQHDMQSSVYETVPKKVVIGDNVVIGSFALILPGVTLAEGAVLGAGSVLAKDIPEYSIFVGNPAAFIKSRNRDIKYKLNFKRYFH